MIHINISVSFEMGIAIKLNNVTICEVDSVQSVGYEYLQRMVCEKLVRVLQTRQFAAHLLIIDFPRSPCRT